MIKFDFHKYMDKYIQNETEKYREKELEIKRRFTEGDLAYWNNLETFISPSELQRIQETAEIIKKNCDVLVVIGIGGSYMGSKAMIEALTTPYQRKTPEILFLGTNLSSEEYQEKLNFIRGKEVYVNVISKSGTTLEISIALDLIMEVLKEKYTEQELQNRIIMTTDKENGTLRKKVEEKGYLSFEIPRNIGGRFSCLTPVGLLPMMVAGVDVNRLLKGVQESMKNLDPAIHYAEIRDILYHQGKRVESFTVYNHKLTYFTEWLKQLFAETQGKNQKGILPVASINTRDLHSQGQYFQQGYDLLFETAIGISKEPKIFLENYQMDLNELNNIAFDKVALAHYQGHTPSNLIMMDEKNEENLGQLLHFFMIAAITGALLLEMNPFDQPGVEDYKKLIKEEINK